MWNFVQIKHEDCNYGEDSGFNINVDKILGQGDEVKITDDNYDLYYGDYEADVEILSSDEVRREAKKLFFLLIRNFRLNRSKRNSQTKQSRGENCQQDRELINF